MKSTRILSIGLFAVGLAAVGLAAQDTFKLARTAKAGATNKYSITSSMQVMGADATFSANLAEKVVKVEDNGDLIIEQITTNAKVSFGGQDMELPQSTGTMKMKANGEILEINSPEPDESTNRREFLNFLKFPDAAVKAGEKWTAEVKASPLNGNTPGKGEYECLGLQKVGDESAIAIKCSYTETKGESPASSSGTVWLSPKDGTLIKAEMTFKNAPIPQVGPVDMKVTIKKVG